MTEFDDLADAGGVGNDHAACRLGDIDAEQLNEFCKKLEAAVQGEWS